VIDSSPLEEGVYEVLRRYAEADTLKPREPQGGAAFLVEANLLTTPRLSVFVHAVVGDHAELVVGVIGTLEYDLTQEDFPKTLNFLLAAMASGGLEELSWSPRSKRRRGRIHLLDGKVLDFGDMLAVPRESRRYLPSRRG